MQAAASNPIVHPLPRSGRTPTHAHYWIAFCTLASALFCGSPCRADLEISGTLVTYSGHVVDTLTTHLEIQGPLVRRRLEGHGTLADFFGRRIEIMHRTSGASTVLDLELGTYTKSAGTSQVCHPWNLFDLRWLGRVQEGQAGVLVWPDTVATFLGLPAHVFDFHFATRQKGGSTIRFWVVYELDSLFGPEAARSLFCGVPVAEADRLLSTQLSKQFGLSAEAIAALQKVRLGYPVRIESFMGQGSSRMDLSRFETLTVQQSDLPDSLFEVPPAFQPADGVKRE